MVNTSIAYIFVWVMLIISINQVMLVGVIVVRSSDNEIDS